jgi:hypothetical protein
LAFMEEKKGEAQMTSNKGNESVAAKRNPENPTSNKQVMEEIGTHPLIL